MALVATVNVLIGYLSLFKDVLPAVLCLLDIGPLLSIEILLLFKDLLLGWRLSLKMSIGEDWSEGLRVIKFTDQDMFVAIFLSTEDPLSKPVLDHLIIRSSIGDNALSFVRHVPLHLLLFTSKVWQIVRSAFSCLPATMTIPHCLLPHTLVILLSLAE